MLCLILSPSHRQRLVELSTTVQVLSPPLGQARLRVVQFFESLFSANKTFVDNRLAEIHVLPKIMDLFFQYEWHNILHCIVDRIFKIVIGGSNEALKNEVGGSSLLSLDGVVACIHAGPVPHPVLPAFVFLSRICVPLLHLPAALQGMQDRQSNSAGSATERSRVVCVLCIPVLYSVGVLSSSVLTPPF